MCVEFLAVSGAGVTIMGHGAAGPLCASSTAVGLLEDAQFTVGEGPCNDAFRTGLAVHAPVLGADTAVLWPTFAGLAAEHGIGGVFAYPLIVGGAKVGVLSLYQSLPGALSDDQHADTSVVVEVLAETVLSLQEAAPEGVLAAEIDDIVAYRAEIYQASGILAVRLGISASDALVLLRAHAFGHELALDAVASSVVDGGLRLGENEQ